MKKICFLKITAIMLVLAGIFSSCGKRAEKEEQNNEEKENEERKYEGYKNYDVSACGIIDPLQNIEWLKEYCESLDFQYFSRVRILLYKVIDTDEHLFKICISYSDFEYSPFPYSEYWRNCIGNLIFVTNSGIPPIPELVEEFLKDKEYVAELFDYVMPLCGVNDPLQNIEWLKEYCGSLKEKQDISSVRIELYKSSDEHLFRIWTFFPYEYAPNEWTEYFSSVWKNCAGEIIFPMFSGESPPLESWEEYLDFLKDKVYIAELFHFVKQ